MLSTIKIRDFFLRLLRVYNRDLVVGKHTIFNILLFQLILSLYIHIHVALFTSTPPPNTLINIIVFSTINIIVVTIGIIDLILSTFSYLIHHFSNQLGILYLHNTMYSNGMNHFDLQIFFFFFVTAILTKCIK